MIRALEMSESLKEIRSLERGLIVLEALAASRGLSLADLHRETGLPKFMIAIDVSYCSPLS